VYPHPALKRLVITRRGGSPPGSIFGDYVVVLPVSEKLSMGIQACRRPPSTIPAPDRSAAARTWPAAYADVTSPGRIELITKIGAAADRISSVLGFIS
jgi:hypothetical protein